MPLAAFAIAVVTFAATLGCGTVSKSGGDGPGDLSGDGFAFRLPPPVSLQELTITAAIVVTGRVTRDLGVRDWNLPLPGDAPRQVLAAPPSVPIHSYELEVAGYLKGAGPQLLVVHQVVNTGSAAAAPGAMRAPDVGAQGLFFLAPETAWGQGGWAAPFGPDGRIVQAKNGAAALDSATRTPIGFLAGKSFTEVEAEVRTLVNTAP
jgi:hypothetical protein